tara:strand:- start:51 stop:545 length:495 start_codon:yes stop_codon:yes gene_type:complete
MLSTYTSGITFKTEKIITKNDIINMCNILGSKEEYRNLCEFQPEGISEGGILFKFKDNLCPMCKEKNSDIKTWYKTVRLCVHSICANGKWYWVNEDYLQDWSGNSDIVFEKNTKFETFLKSFNGAPVFTEEELKIWEDSFKEIGIIKVGKYPSKKSLKTRDKVC